MLFILFFELAYALESVTDCLSPQYYNSATWTCTACPTNTIRYNSTLCICDLSAGYKRASDSIIGFQYSSLCTSFGTGCTSATETVLRYNKIGTAIATNQCISCATNAYPDPLREQCLTCTHQNMTYKGGCVCGDSFTQTNDTCIKTTDLTINSIDWTDEYKMQFDIEVQSDFIKNKYQYAVVGCYTYKTIDACQLLINTCIFQLYNRKYDICDIFFDSTMNVTTIPTLFYLNSNQVDVYQDTSFSQTMALDSTSESRYLPYYLGVYSIDGTFLEYRLLQSELILCPHQPLDAKNARAFGLNMKIDCTISMQPFVDDYNMYFYELFLKTTTGYTRVPILIQNYQTKDGSTPNSYGLDQFVTRFFVVDNVATKSDYKNAYIKPTYLRYAKSIKIMVSPRKDSIETIYIPYVIISYETMKGNNGVFGSASLEFRVQHDYDSTTYWNTILILFIVYNVVILCVWLFRVYVWTKANPRESLGSSYTWQLMKNTLRLLLDSWDDWMFYFLFFMTAYWFVFFKFQNSPFIMMLNQDDYTTNYQPFLALFYIIFAIRIILVLHLIISQSSINLFFIDWEKTEFELPQQDSIMENHVNDIKNKQSVWRTLLVANEFSELQVIRTLNIEWTLLILGFVLMGLNFDLRFSESPDLIETQSFVPENPILKYFLIQFVYLVIGLGQLIIRRILNIWMPYPHEDFVDLCSIANVSIFILDDNLHGYYIHGENPFGFSEGSLQHLQECFRNETKEKGKNRGLIKDGYDSQLCTFELFVPPKFKTQFDRAYESLKNYKEKQELQQLGVEYVEVQRFQIDQFLKGKINEVRRVDRRSNFIRTKETAQRFFDYPPDEIGQQDFNNLNLPYFFRDPDQNYKKVLFCGNEIFLLVTDVMLYTFWVLITDNLAGSILLQYLCTKAAEWLKQELQKSNLSSKTRIDKRFLI